MSATSSAQRELWPHPFGELFDDSARKPEATIHVLWRELGREPDALDYLERIIGAVAGIDSPFLATMRGASRDGDGRLVLAYERLDGEDLGTALSRGPFAIERAVAVLRQLCRGLATAHAAGINHRALGPASIVLLRDGSHPDAVKIIDFGIAGVLGEADAKYSPLLPMTPERLLGFGTHTSEDVYLIGCIGYWMLAGVPPFAADDGDSLRRRHAIEDVAPLRSVAKHVPTALARVLEDALVKDPDDRTADLAALELALARAQRDAGITTPWDAHVEALTERARVLGECPAASGVFQSVSGRGGKRTPSGSHRPVPGNGAAANHSPKRGMVATGPGAREAAASGGAALPASSMRMPRPKPTAPAAAKVVRPIGGAAPASEVKPVEAKPVAVKPIEAKPIEAKPVEAKPVEAKPVAVKPVEAKPVEAKPVAVKPVEAKPIAMPAKPVEPRPVAKLPAPARSITPAKPLAATPVEATPVEAKPVAAKPIDAKPVDTKPVDTKPVVAKPSEVKPATARIPPPPRLTPRVAPLRVEPMPSAPAPLAKDVATPTAATSLVGLSLADVEALGAGLNLPEPPPPAPAPEPPAVAAASEPAVAKNEPAVVAPIEAPAIAPSEIAAPPATIAATLAVAAPTQTEPALDVTPDSRLAMLPPLADRSDDLPLVLATRRRPAWLVPVLAGAGLITVLALAYGTSTPSPTPAPSTPAVASSTAPTPPAVSPTAPSAPAPSIAPTAPEIAVAAPPPIAPGSVTPAVAPADPSTVKPAAVTVDPLRQHLIRAKEARKKGKSDEAIASYRAALRLDAANRTALRELSRLYFDAGNYESAARYGKQLVNASNASAGDRVALGDAYFKLGRTADAKAQYQKAAASGDATAKKRLAKLGG